jgi:hypothetical protein
MSPFIAGGGEETISLISDGAKFSYNSFPSCVLGGREGAEVRGEDEL